MAKDPRYKDVRFMSICCDGLNGAGLAVDCCKSFGWENIEHFSIETTPKEEAKRLLGFKRVPFYVVINKRGEVLQKGGASEIDFEMISLHTDNTQEDETPQPQEFLEPLPPLMEVMVRKKSRMLNSSEEGSGTENLCDVFDLEFQVDRMIL